MSRQAEETILLENVAAISGEFHRDPRYGAFYEQWCDSLSGFPGIWSLMVRVGLAFTKAEAVIPEDEWIEVVDKVADYMYEDENFAPACNQADLDAIVLKWAYKAIAK